MNSCISEEDSTRVIVSSEKLKEKWKPHDIDAVVTYRSYTLDFFHAQNHHPALAIELDFLKPRDLGVEIQSKKTRRNHSEIITRKPSKSSLASTFSLP